MSYDTERADIAGYLQTNWTTTDIRYPNRKFDQPKDAIWLSFVIKQTEPLSRSFGTTQDVEFGGRIVLTLFAPKYSGESTVYGYVDTLYDLFFHKTIGSVDTYVPEVVTVGDTENWFQVTMTVPYTRDKTLTVG